MTRTIAPGIAPPDESRTTPVMVLAAVPVPACGQQTRWRRTANGDDERGHEDGRSDQLSGNHCEFSLNAQAHRARIR